MDELLGSAPKKYAPRYFQLITGHGAICTFLVKVGGDRNPRMLIMRGAEQFCSSVERLEHLYNTRSVEA